jgi:3-dehydroquinate dehydratase/shikimate dehydrogenase
VAEEAPATRVVGIIAERTPALARAEAGLAAPLCDLLEMRLDFLEEPPDAAALFRDLPRPAVATVRRPAEGGRWAGPEDERLRLLAAAGRAGAAYVDVECGVPVPADIGSAAVLRSLHLQAGDPEAPKPALARLEAEPGEVLKLVLPAMDAPAALAVLRLLKDRPEGARPLSALASGSAGIVSRILQPVFGGALVYASSRRCREPMPGLPSLADLEDIYGLRRLRKGTAFYALLGRPLRHSVSPRAMNAALRSAGKDAVYVPVTCDDAEKTARQLMELGAAGLAFTAPHKAVPLWMASLTEAVAAHAIAANTLFRQGNGLVAANTDGPAARRLARDALQSLQGKLALVLGTGGTARAVAAALSEERCRVHLLGRNHDKTAAAAATTGAVPGRPGEAEVDLLFNATPVGQWPGAPRDPAAFLCPGITAKVRFDAVYNPRSTAFLQAGTGKTIRGIDMLVAQGADQLRLFGIAKPDVETMRRTLEEALDRMELRVLLLGMRGAGKTSVGEALAAATERPLQDTDRMVEQRAGKKVAEIFARYGEAAFRLLERDAVASALRGTGTVVALGGGAAQHLEGRPAASAVVWLRAPREVLVERIRGSGRPSLRGKPAEQEIDELLVAREPLYAGLATMTVDTGGRTPGEVAAEIAGKLGL